MYKTGGIVILALYVFFLNFSYLIFFSTFFFLGVYVLQGEGGGRVVHLLPLFLPLLLHLFPTSWTDREKRNLLLGFLLFFLLLRRKKRTYPQHIH